jgi:hypothetical protein
MNQGPGIATEMPHFRRALTTLVKIGVNFGLRGEKLTDTTTFLEAVKQQILEASKAHRRRSTIRTSYISTRFLNSRQAYRWIAINVP